MEILLQLAGLETQIQISSPVEVYYQRQVQQSLIQPYRQLYEFVNQESSNQLQVILKAEIEIVLDQYLESLQQMEQLKVSFFFLSQRLSPFTYRFQECLALIDGEFKQMDLSQRVNQQMFQVELQQLLQDIQNHPQLGQMARLLNGQVQFGDLPHNHAEVEEFINKLRVDMETQICKQYEKDINNKLDELHQVFFMKNLVFDECQFKLASVEMLLDGFELQRQVSYTFQSEQLRWYFGDTIEQYAAIFQLLFQLKKSTFDLIQVKPQSRIQSLLRQRLIYLLTTIIQFIQVDIVDALAKNLKVGRSQHQHFVETATQQTFVRITPIMQCYDKIMDCSRNIQDPKTGKQLAHNVSFLCKSLEMVATQVPLVDALLIKLNFNNYYK